MSEARASTTVAQTDLELIAAPGSGRQIVVEALQISAAGAVAVFVSAEYQIRDIGAVLP